MPAAIISSTSAVSPLLAVSMKAESVAGPITNSILVAAIVTSLIVWFVRSAMKNPQTVPSGKQNVVELIVEFLYNQVEGIVGKKVAPRAFPLLATLFVYILVSNWFGLLPGVGTIGWKHAAGHAEVHAPAAVASTEEHPAPAAAADHGDQGGHGEHHGAVAVPFLRPVTADMNATVGMAIVFMLVWLYITIREAGVVGFLKHTFGPKGGLKGFMGIVVALVFFVVGWIEIVSILFRPVSLSFRLFGNIFAGENLLHTMSSLGGVFHAPPFLDFIMKVLLPIPFYFMELLVGALQATVFALLCAVYIQLSTAHDDHGHEEGHGDDADHAHGH